MVPTEYNSEIKQLGFHTFKNTILHWVETRLLAACHVKVQEATWVYTNHPTVAMVTKQIQQTATSIVTPWNYKC